MTKRRRNDPSAETPSPASSTPGDDAAKSAQGSAGHASSEGPTPPEADGAQTAPKSSGDGGDPAPQRAESSETPQATRRGRKGRKGGKREQADAAGAAGSSGNGEPPEGAGGAAPPPRKGGRIIGTLALLLALAAGAMAGYVGWRLMELEARVARVPEQREAALEPLATQEQLSAVEREIEQRSTTLERRIEDQLADLEQRIGRAEDERSTALERLRQRVETAETAVQSLREQRERDGADWRMAEVRYLVSMAVRQLQITGNVAGAIAALEAADHALGQMGDPRVLALRERIVEDIGRLREVEPADVQGIALRVQNLAPRIPDLVRAGQAEEPAAQGSGENGPDEATGPDGGEGWWASVREQLDQLVTVRREPEPSPPAPDASVSEAPAPSAELPPAERLLLALREASRAALNHEPQAYRAALERAREILESEYDPAAPANERFREDLGALQDRRVATELPDLTPTLERTQSLAARLAGENAEGDR